MSGGQVMCVRSEWIARFVGENTGIIPVDENALPRILSPEQVWWVPRTWAEHDPTFRQVIPYTIVLGPRSGPDLVLTYRRAKTGGDPRLQGLRTAGFGGHVEPEDRRSDPVRTVYAGRSREMEEELGLGPAADLKFIGLIIAPRTEEPARGTVSVEDVHVGFLFIERLLVATAMTEDDTIEDVKFEPLRNVAVSVAFNKLERWSAYAIAHVMERRQLGTL